MNARMLGIIDWKVRRACALEGLRGVDTQLAIDVWQAYAIAQQSARHSKFSKLVDSGQALPLRESNNPFAAICAPQHKGGKNLPKTMRLYFSNPFARM